MAGYSARQSSFTTGDTITAAHSNDEFNQVLAAFNATTGHSHDGTSGEVGPISTLRDADSNNKVLIDTTNNYIEFYVQVSSSPVQQLYIADGAIIPVTDNDIDLGTSSLEFKDGYFDGTLYADAINFNGTAAAVDNDGHDIRTIRINSTDGSSDANDRIILNGTDGTSANAGDGLMAEQIDIQLEGVDSATDVRSETKTGDDSEVVMLLEDESQETGSDKLVLNGTDGSSLHALSLIHI